MLIRTLTEIEGISEASIKIIRELISPKATKISFTSIFYMISPSPTNVRFTARVEFFFFFFNPNIFVDKEKIIRVFDLRIVGPK